MELLALAGDFERLEAALAFGADTVYLAVKEFGIGVGPTNFSPGGLTAAVQAAHRKGTRVHMTYSMLPRVDEFDCLLDLLRYAQQVEMNALIVTDLGVMELAQKYVSNMKLHVSIQAGVVSHKTARVFYEMGASHMMLVRKLSVGEIAQIRAKMLPELELEAFVHGSMCASFPGRCLLSSYLIGRNTNRDDHAQSCRWSYRLVKEKRLGEYSPVKEDDRGTYILSSHDMRMIRHILELQKAGINSPKIGDQVKSAYYMAVTVNTYRSAINFCEQHPGEPLLEWIPEELSKTSHRECSTGFYFGTPGQVYQNGGYVCDYGVAIVCEGQGNGMTTPSQRSRFFQGDTVDVLGPGAQSYLLTLGELYDAGMTPIDTAPHATMRVLTKIEHPVKPGASLQWICGE